MKAANKLVGSYANLKPGNPEQFARSLADVLEAYPLGVVLECTDARFGIARHVEFLSIKSIVEWMDKRLAYYRSVASYVAPPPPRVELTFSEEHCAKMRERFQALLRFLRGDDAKISQAHATLDRYKAASE